MKIIIKKIYSLLFYLCLIGRDNIKSKKTLFYLSRLIVEKHNTINFNNAILEHTTIQIKGKNNHLTCNNALYRCNISVIGNNNKIEFSDKSKIHFTHIIIRGNNCNFNIDEASTIGSAYLVCMGQENQLLIGKNCMIADNVEIWNTDSHPITNNNKIINHSKPVIIGDHVWLGKHSVILKGVTIGNNAIIGMRSIITKNIEANSLYVGNPARLIKRDINWEREFINI